MLVGIPNKFGDYYNSMLHFEVMLTINISLHWTYPSLGSWLGEALELIHDQLPGEGYELYRNSNK